MALHNITQHCITVEHLETNYPNFRSRTTPPNTRPPVLIYMTPSSQLLHFSLTEFVILMCK